MNGIIKFGCAALAVALLTGCTTDFYDSRMRAYAPQSVEDRFPIEVVEGTVRVRLPVASGRLSPKERQTLEQLGQRASSMNGLVYVTRPARSVKGEVLAAEVTEVLTRMGVHPNRIRHHANGAAGEVVVAYRRKFAVTKECGNWTTPVNETAQNDVHQNFGCAQQHNLAAMVDNPEDFERPRVMTPPDSDARNEAIKRYRKQQDTTSAWPGGVKPTINIGVDKIAKK